MLRALRRTAAVPISLLAFLAATPLAATTYVLVSDRTLVEQAEIIVHGRVVDAAVGENRGAVRTYYTVAAAEILKGDAPGTLVLPVLGGALPGGRVDHVPGAPRFAPGDEVLLFLGQRRDGSPAVLHLMQGAFVAVEIDGERMWYRGLPETRPLRETPPRETLPRKDGAAPAALARHGDRFLDWVRDLAGGVERPDDYRIALPESVAIEKFTFFGVPFGPFQEIFRWTELNAGDAVFWHRHEDGQPGSSDGGRGAFRRALASWNREPVTPLRLRDAGTTSSTAGISRDDGRNTILFHDPEGEMGAPFDCEQGGVMSNLRLSGSRADGGEWKGMTFLATLEADIVVNRGVECVAREDPEFLELIYLHELGHTLGLGESCLFGFFYPACTAFLRHSAMRGRFEIGPRVAVLGQDDVDGIRFLYSTTLDRDSCPVALGDARFCAECGGCGNAGGGCDDDGQCLDGLACAGRGSSFGLGSGVTVCVAAGDDGTCPVAVGDGRFCTECGPCDEGQGDCDRDDECREGLTCFQDVGFAFGFNPRIDVCLRDGGGGGGGGGGGCPVAAGSGRFCTECGPCDEGQGDCDRDDECRPGLVCADDVGADFGFGPGIDVCVAPGGGCPVAAGSGRFCTECGPCGAGEGDCDRDEECRDGLRCVQDVGADFGFGPGIDVCL